MGLSKAQLLAFQLLNFVVGATECYLWHSIFTGGFTGIPDFIVAAFLGRVEGNPYLTDT